MVLNLNNLRPAWGAKKKKKRVGRGDSSGHGTYSTRGAKGQRARSGGKGGLKLKGLKGNILSIPKLGGFRSLKPKLEIVNLQDLEKNFADNDIITAGKLAAKGLIKGTRAGVKILGMGELKKKLIIKIDRISASAQEAVKKAGGEVILLSHNKKELKEEKKQ